MRDNALDYARRGWPVFPVAITKQPLIKRWQQRASTDPVVVWDWWERHPDAGIGCATGHIFDVIDLDGPQARAHFEQMALEAGHAYSGPISRTGRPEGGWQVFYRPTGMGNRKPTPDGVDFRGHGGFVILPPSRHRSGNVYTWLREPGAEFPELPPVLRLQLFPRRKPPRIHQPPPPEVEADFRLKAWASAALECITAELATVERGKGLRNITLNDLSFRAWQLAHILGEAKVEAALLQAATDNGYVADKGTRRAMSTINSARAGLNAPRWPAEDRGNR
jgi:hypothetical protein